MQNQDRETIRLQLASQEAREVFRAMMSFASITNHSLNEDENELYSLAIKWGKAKLMPNVTPGNAAEPPHPLPAEVVKGSAPPISPDLKLMVFATPGQFYDAAHKQFGLYKEKVDAEIKGLDLRKPEDRRKGWELIVSNHQKRHD